jgi:hypothetical protein
MSYVQKIISTTITLSNNTFAGTSGQNTVTLNNYRTSASITKAGGNSQGELQIRIYGLDLYLMNQLSILGRTPIFIDSGNKIAVSAGDSVNGVSVVFVGTIIQAQIDLSGAPDAILVITAYAGASEAMQVIPPSSYKGGADAANVMAGLATHASLLFENNGVSVMINNSYYSGSVRSQMEDCAKEAHINWVIDDGTLAIWPKDGSRGGIIPMISKDTGLIGYPFPSGQGLLGLRTEFNPQISFGGNIQVESIITAANGKWTVNHIEHEIESQLPGGHWMTTLQCTPPGYMRTH